MLHRVKLSLALWAGVHVRTAMNRERVRERIAHGGEECRREKTSTPINVCRVSTIRLNDALNVKKKRCIEFENNTVSLPIDHIICNFMINRLMVHNVLRSLYCKNGSFRGHCVNSVLHKSTHCWLKALWPGVNVVLRWDGIKQVCQMGLLGEMVKGQCEAFSKIVFLLVGLEVRIVFRLDVVLLWFETSCLFVENIEARW